VTTVRRRILRSALPPAADARQVARLQRRRAELIKNRAAFPRWLTRLKRATNMVVGLHGKICRLVELIADG
jgi:hypothetical protein